MKAKQRVCEVGEATAKLIDYLVFTLGIGLDDLILIAYSLGAHACGIISKNIKSGKVAAIIGRDPALPLFIWRIKYIDFIIQIQNKFTLFIQVVVF